MIENWNTLRGHFSRAMLVLVVCLQWVPSFAAEESLESYRELKPIALFGSISVSVYDADAKTPDRETTVSSEELTRYLQLQFASYFPDIPYSSVDALERPDQKDKGSVGNLLCRVWFDGGNSPAVFQVRCQISTSAHLSIIDDVSFGYGPKEKAPAIIREQIDQILKGFAMIFFRVRNEM